MEHYRYDGNFSIAFLKSMLMVFTYIGFPTQGNYLGWRVRVDVIMHEDVELCG